MKPFHSFYVYSSAIVYEREMEFLKKMKLFFVGVLFLLVVGLAACGDEESSEHIGANSKDKSTEETAGEEDSDKNEVIQENLLDWETSNFEESGNKIIPVEEGNLPETPNSFLTFANDGIFILGGNWQNYFYDYLNGSMSAYDLDGIGNPNQSNEIGAWTYLYDKYFYSINNEEENPEESQIVEVNTETGEKQVFMTVDETSHIVEKDRILYIAENANFFAYDINNDENLWEIEPDVNFNVINIQATDNSIVLLGDEGLAVYDLSNGEKRYEVEGYFEDIVVDGESFYVLETDEEALFELENPIYNVYRFNQETDEGEKLFTTPEVNSSSEYGELELGMDNDNIYVKTKYGVLAYDKDNANALWTVLIGEGLVQELDETVTDDFQVVYNNGKVYIRTSIWGTTPGPETTFTVIDGKTGEMLENYAIGAGEAFGPVVDGESVVLFQSDETKGERQLKFYVIP